MTIENGYGVHLIDSSEVLIKNIINFIFIFIKILLIKKESLCCFKISDNRNLNSEKCYLGNR